MAPTLLLGTATFGMDLTEFQTKSGVSKVLEFCRGSGVSAIDTGARYPPLNPGKAERLLGEASSLCDQFNVDTKVFTGKGDGSGDLSGPSMKLSVEKSLESLKLKQVRVLYAHRPDPQTPLEGQIEAFNDQITSGHCQEYGVSNHTVDVLENILSVCEKNGYRKPSMYQGDYNLITRGMGQELLPLLRRHGMRYVAFRPLAAGFLTGKFLDGQGQGTRFGDDNPLGKAFQGIYGWAKLRECLQEFKASVKAQGLTTIQVGLRWLYHHSKLSSSDGMILGASKLVQLKENIEILQQGPLPPETVESVDRLWNELEESRASIL